MQPQSLARASPRLDFISRTFSFRAVKMRGFVKIGRSEEFFIMGVKGDSAAGQTKRCNRCGEAKPLGDYPAAKDCAQGRAGTCKRCKADRKRELYRERRGPKRCRVCHQPKGPGRCRPCRLATLARYRETHAAELRERARDRYQSSPDVREQGKARNYRWRAGEGRGKYLESKARESERRAGREGRTYRPRGGDAERP